MGKLNMRGEIDATAADWAVRVDDAMLRPGEQAELDAWLAVDIRRRGAFARAQAVLLHAQRARALGREFDPDAYLAAHANSARAPAPLAKAFGRPTRRRLFVLGGSAAAIAASALLLLDFGTPAQAYATSLGEVRLVPLEDGSGMTLNTASQVTVSYSRRERHIELAHGEALFEVAKDAGRPFTVVAGTTEIRAIGTSFTVQRLPGKPVQVLVREGVVEIRSLRFPDRPARRVTANARAVAPISQPMEIARVAPAELGRELAWREGMLSFEDMSLFDAAKQFGRYSSKRIVFTDPAVGRETITGLFRANDPDGFARSAALSLELRAEGTADGILLTKRP